MPQIDRIDPEADGKWHFHHPEGLLEHIRIATVREAPKFSPTFERSGGTYLQLGPGRKIIDDSNSSYKCPVTWINLDYPEWDGNEEDSLQHIEEESISGIVTYNTLDHLTDPRRILRSAARVLEDDAWFVCIVPHYLGELANACFDHKVRFAIDSWRNALSSEHDTSTEGIPEFRLGFNMIMGYSEANLFLVTQMFRNPR